MTTSREPFGVLGWSLLGVVLVAVMLSWVLVLPAPAHGRSPRPPLLTPVSLDWINNSQVAVPSPQPSSSAAGEEKRDGLRAW